MSWFDEQIRQRMRSDKDVMRKSLEKLAAAINREQALRIDPEDRLSATRVALGEVLSFYRCDIPEFPLHLEEFDEQLEYMLRPSGMMRRTVALTEGWYKNAIGPLMGFLKTGGLAVALLPPPLFG